MKEKCIKTIKNANKINSFGGMIAKTFEELNREITEINETILLLAQALGLEFSSAELLDIAKKGLYELSNIYKKKEFERRRFANPENITNAQIKISISNDFNKVFKSFDRNSTKGFIGGNYPLISNYFSDAVKYDNESGFIIDGNAFLSIYEQLSQTRKTDAYKRHEIAVNAVNDLFQGVTVTWDEMQKYFIVKNGRLAINPQVEIDNLYLRLS